MKRGELSITIVVVIVLALLVLAILGFVLLKAGGGIGGVGVKCAQAGGICQADQCQNTPVSGPSNDCKAPSSICCRATPSAT